MSAVPLAAAGSVDYTMSHADYLALPALGSSGVKRLLRSPAHYRSGGASIDPQTAAIGTAAHMAVLEPARFERECVAAPRFDRRTTAGKAAAAAFEAEHAQHLVIPADGFDAVRRMADAVRAHPAAAGLLSHGVAEVSLQWTDQASGAPCKARPDWLRPDSIIVDVKTTRDGSPAGFGRAIGQYGYAVQAAWYLAGAREVLRDDGCSFVFLCVEKEPPYAVGVYVLEQPSIDAAAERIQRALARWRECNESGVWPAYSDLIEPINAPAWAL